jgi:hypothetical protein
LATAAEFSREKSAARLLALYEKILAGGHYPHLAARDRLEAALLAIKTEWELVQEKAAAAVNAFSDFGNDPENRA